MGVWVGVCGWRGRMASHLENVIHSMHPEAEEDELSELAMAAMESAQTRAELAQHFDSTDKEECIVMSILHNGSDDACGFVCWALHALAADPEHRRSLVHAAVATGLREAMVRSQLSHHLQASCPRRPAIAAATAAAPFTMVLYRRRNMRDMRRFSGQCCACSSKSLISRKVRACWRNVLACVRY